MRRLLAALALIAFTACTSKTEHGRCIGAFTDPDPRYVYETSGWNVAMAVIFIETLVVPAVVVANQAKCPVAERESEVETPAKIGPRP